MKTSIKTYKDLLEEEIRLEHLLSYQKTLIQKDIADIKEELKPLASVLSFVGKLTSKDKSNPMVNLGLGIAGDFLLKNVLFAGGGFITKLIGPYLIRNFGAQLLPKNGDGLLHMITEKFHQLTARFKKKAA